MDSSHCSKTTRKWTLRVVGIKSVVRGDRGDAPKKDINIFLFERGRNKKSEF